MQTQILYMAESNSDNFLDQIEVKLTIEYHSDN